MTDEKENEMLMQMISDLICPSCQNILTPDNIFCPKCGVKIKEASLSLTIGKQIGIYALSFFLPPLGLWPAVKYLKQNDPKAKRIGMIAIVLTVVSILISVWFSMAVLNQFNSVYSAQFKQYQNLGL